ncbi:MAG: hypothetical protein HYY24_27915 [Verrucomicrobia bacterium]|nr:hypothetical protein [Verrucomicrobiota bacterium]
MKKTFLLAMTGLSLALAGCVVTSVYPFYTAKDVVFDPALLGTWIEGDPDSKSEDTWTFAKGDGQEYKLTIGSDAKGEVYDATLFKFTGDSFLDLFPARSEGGGIPPHMLIRVAQIQPSLKMASLKYDWLKQLVEKDPRAIRHVRIKEKDSDGKVDYRVVLTADTDALQSFVRKHLRTAEAWDGGGEMKRQDARK